MPWLFLRIPAACIPCEPVPMPPSGKEISSVALPVKVVPVIVITSFKLDLFVNIQRVR